MPLADMRTLVYQNLIDLFFGMAVGMQKYQPEKRKRTAASAITTNFVRYVMTDELNKDRKGGCGHRENKAEWDSSVVADVLDIVKIQDIKACTTQPIWLNVWVPSDARAGKYKGTLTVSGKNFQDMKLQVEIDVLNRTLPAPQDWAFHLDLWQNPYSVARYYQVPLWSKEHFDAMLPIMKMLANAGQRAITTSIMHKPWAGQSLFLCLRFLRKVIPPIEESSGI